MKCRKNHNFRLYRIWGIVLNSKYKGGNFTPNITIEVPANIEKEIPKNKKELTKVFLLGLKHEKAHKA